MNQSYQAFLVPLFLLLLLVSLFSCGEMTRQIIGSNSERFSEVDIKIDTATVASEVIQVKGSIYDLTYPDEPLLFASVTVLNNGKSIAGTETNFDGDFEIILSVDSLDSTDFALDLHFKCRLGPSPFSLHRRLKRVDASWSQARCTCLVRFSYPS